MNIFGVLLLVGLGLLFLVSAVLDQDWLLTNRRTQFLMQIVGRIGARIFWGVIGLLMVVYGGVNALTLP